MGAGGFASVDGASELAGIVETRLGPSLVAGGAPGPTGRMLWLALIKLAMPPAGGPELSWPEPAEHLELCMLGLEW